MRPDPKSNWSARGSILTGMVTLVVLVFGFGYWASQSQISGAIIAPGQIKVEQNQQVVQHPDGGVVKAILVEDGDRVEIGDLLLSLEPDRLISELSVVEGQLFETMARRGRLEAERDKHADIRFDQRLLQAGAANPEIQSLADGQQRLFEARQATLDKEIEQLEKRTGQIVSQIGGIAAQQAALATQLDLIEQERRDQQTLLDKGLAQASRVLSLQREFARLTGSVGELSAGKAEAEGRITEIDLAILKLDVDRREQAITTLRDLQFRELELGQKRGELQRRLSRLDIRAPVAGVVIGKTVFALRSVIRPADPLMYLVPQDRPLVISVRVDPIHIDQVFIGQDVTLRLPTLDTRQTPELTGRVVKISADAFTDERTLGSYYLSEIVLLDGELSKLPENTVLIPGMPVEAFLRTQDRTPLAYLVKPLADYFAKAFREG